MTGLNPDSSRIEDLNQGPPDFKSRALNHLTTLPPYKHGNGEAGKRGSRKEERKKVGKWASRESGKS